jgi:hypothetical protein
MSVTSLAKLPLLSTNNTPLAPVNRHTHVKRMTKTSKAFICDNKKQDSLKATYTHSTEHIPL